MNYLVFLKYHNCMMMVGFNILADSYPTIDVILIDLNISHPQPQLLTVYCEFELQNDLKLCLRSAKLPRRQGITLYYSIINRDL